MLTENGAMSTITPSSPVAATGRNRARWRDIAGHVRVVALLALLVAAFWPILVSMYGSWFDEHAYMEHGILVIPAAAYMVWTKRNKLSQVPRKPSAWGVVLLLGGALQALLGLAAHWVWISRMAFLVSLVGFIMSFYGLRMARALVYPLCTLTLMVAPPT